MSSNSNCIGTLVCMEISVFQLFKLKMEHFNWEKLKKKMTSKMYSLHPIYYQKPLLVLKIRVNHLSEIVIHEKKKTHPHFIVKPKYFTQNLI